MIKYAELPENKLPPFARDLNLHQRRKLDDALAAMRPDHKRRETAPESTGKSKGVDQPKLVEGRWQ